MAGSSAWYRLAIVTACGALGMAFAPQNSAAQQDSEPSEETTLLAAKAAPVVHMIQAEFTGTLAITHYEARDAQLARLEARLQAEQTAGRIPPDLQSINRRWLEILANNVETYFRPGQTDLHEAEAAVLCSGWFATPEGHMVTAAHCVKDDPASVTGTLAARVLPGVMDSDYRDSLKNFRGIPLDAGMRKNLRKIAENWYTRHTELRESETSVTVALGIRGEGTERVSEPVPAEVLSVGEPYPGRDVAVLKVDGYEQLPSLPLGDERQLRVGDRLYIDGFPGTVRDNPIFSTESQQEPTFTEGPVSAIRETTEGVPYLQTQAPAYKGNSGGPVLGADGKVVGILIAGSRDPATGEIVAGEQYVLPASVIAEELAKHDVRARPGTVSNAFGAAMNNYFRAYHRWALDGLKFVQHEFPEHPYAAKYAELAEQEIQAGKDRSPAVRAQPETPISVPGYLSIVAVVTALAVLGVTGYLRRGKRIGK